MVPSRVGWPCVRGEHIARVRFAVEQLLAAPANGPTRSSQRVAENLAVRIVERWSAISIRQELLSGAGTIHEMWRRDIELAHSGMESLECTGVVDR